MAGMWWGTAIEAPDPSALAKLYSDLLGWPPRTRGNWYGHPPGARGSIYVVFQQATDYQAPVWPPADAKQRPMMHFDF